MRITFKIPFQLYGKGTVQSVFPLDRYNDQLGALKVTTANFYRVNGGSTQLKGVAPDIVIPSAMDVMEIGEEFLPNVLDWSEVDSADFPAAADMQTLTRTLKERSRLRLDADERYAAYRTLVDRLEERTQLKEISLNLDDRLELAQRDQELETFQEEISDRLRGYDSEDAEEGETVIRSTDAADVLLAESLNILSDLIDHGTLSDAVEVGQNEARSPDA